jgi:hypothetical protein
MTKRIVRVEIHRESFHGGYYKFAEGWPLTSFAECIAEWTEAVPEEFRGTAALEISTESEYESYFAQLTVFYDRPETDAEESAREHQERVDAARKQEAELRTLAELKAKYGG